MSELSELLLQNLSEIKRISVGLCRRKGIERDEAEEFADVVIVRLVDDDYAILRAFERRSSFRTFIAAVIGRMFIDYWRQEHGKWRSSAAAEHLGAPAVELERLLYRDGRPLEDATALLLTSHPQLTPADVRDLAARIPPRERRVLVGIEEALALTAPDAALRVERMETASCISRVIREAIEELPDEDKLILQLRFDSAMTVQQMARALDLDYQFLWRRLQKLYADLRRRLQLAGIAAGDVEDIIGSDVLLDFRLKNGGARPSAPKESDATARQKEMP